MTVGKPEFSKIPHRNLQRFRYDFFKEIVRARPKTHLSGFRGPLALGLVAAALAQPMKAQTADVISHLDQSADLVADVEQVCPLPQRSEVYGRYTLLNRDRLPEDYGSASVYKLSANIFWSAKTEDGKPVLVLYTGKPDPARSCATLLVLNAQPGKVRLKPPVKDGNFRAHLPQIVSDEVDRLLAECQQNPRRARRDYLPGDFWVSPEGGEVMNIENTFNCDSAVLTTISAIDITAKGKTIRAVYVHDTLFLFEMGK